MATPSFPMFRRLPDELKVMIWKEATKAEAASRIVPLHASNVGPHLFPTMSNCQTPALSLMPLKRLISPLLAVCVQSREVALRHYGTRVNVYEQPSPMDAGGYESQIRAPWGMTCQEFTEWRFKSLRGRSVTEEAPSSVQSGFFHPLRATEPVWADRECISDGIDSWLETKASNYNAGGPVDNRVEEDENDYEEYEVDAAIQNEQAYRGCVYLDLASDRFILLTIPKDCYGLREVSKALNDFKYGISSPSLPDLYKTVREIVARRPPVLRHTSAHLSDEVLMGIRHAVLPAYSVPRHFIITRSYSWTSFRRIFSHNPWSIWADPPEDEQAITTNNTPGTRLGAPCTFPSYSWAMALPGAFGATPSSTTWGFSTNSEMYRTFFDDIEDKGPEHLCLQQVRKDSIGSGPEDWEMLWD